MPYMQKVGGQPMANNANHNTPAHMKVADLSGEHFNKLINSNVDPSKMIIIMFYAPWCGHCTKMKPELEAAAADTDESMLFAKIDGDANPEITKKMNISGFPTTFVYDKGDLQKECAKLEGFVNKNDLVLKLQKQKQAKLGGSTKKAKFIFVPDRR